MATRIEKILTRARDTLADPSAQRWSDDRLLRLLDEAQSDLAKQTKILKGQYNFPVLPGVSTYTLPDNLWLITRATFNSEVIPLVSYDNMDTVLRSDTTPVTRAWQLDVGEEVKSIIYDRRNVQEIKVYPIPEAPSDGRYAFTSDNTEFAGAELLGIVADIEGYTFSSPFGIIADLYEPNYTELSDVYGVTTDLIDLKSVYLWYIRIPDTISSVEDELEIPAMFDVALKHYVVANAFRDDLDVQYRQMGAESMTMYNKELELASATNHTDGTRRSSTHRAPYRGAFN